MNIVIGTSILVKATFKDAAGNICEPVANVTWSSSAPSVASVTKSNNSYRTLFDRAQIAALATGSATITASSLDLNNGAISATFSAVVSADGPSTMAINVIP